MSEKVVFYPLTKTIKINSGVTSIDFKVDIYSDGKEDWLSTTYNKYKFPVRSIGGEVVTGGKVLEPTFFLMYGWQIEPASENHELTISGNIFHDDSIPIIKIPSGGYSVIVNLSTTISPDRVNQDIVQQASETGLYEGMVCIDVNSSYSGTYVPLGTHLFPVNNLNDAKTIAASRGLITLKLLSDLTVLGTEDISNYKFTAETWDTLITLESGSLSENTIFEKMSVDGELGGFWNVFIDCWLYTVTNFCGWMVGGSFENITLAPYNIYSLGQSYFDGLVPMYPNTPSILTMNTDVAVALTNISDICEIRNMTEGSILNFGISRGIVILDSSCTGGLAIFLGIGQLVNESSIVPDTTNLLNLGTVTNAVWDESHNEHEIAGSTGYALMLIQTILRNKMITDPVTGLLSIYDDNNVLLMQAQIYEDALGIQKYQGKGADRRERLT